jgi:hypothetical protein
MRWKIARKTERALQAAAAAAGRVMKGNHQDGATIGAVWGRHFVQARNAGRILVIQVCAHADFFFWLEDGAGRILFRVHVQNRSGPYARSGGQISRK